MKVLMTADAVGGVWTYALDLARGLVDGPAGHGAETVLAVLGPGLDAQRREAAAAVPRLTLIETGLPLDWLAEDAEAIVLAGRRSADLARLHRVDLVHLNSPALAADASFPVPVVGVCHSCVTTWWEAMRDAALPDDFRWRADLVRQGYARCDALIAPSAAFAAATERAYGLPAPTVVVHNGRSQAPNPSPVGEGGMSPRRAPGADRLCPPGRENRAACTVDPLAPLGKGSPAPSPSPAFVFTAGRLWDEGKNVAALDRLAARLDLPVRAAGPTRGPNGTAIRLEALQELGSLEPDTVAEILRSRPIFASLARYEPFGLAVLEAAQAGCALVLSDIATFRELWDGAAVFVAPDDDAGAADAIRQLTTDPDLRAERGEAARSRAARYTPDAMTAGTLAVYRQVLAARTRSSAAA